MKLPIDYEERISIVDNILISFQKIKEWQSRNMLEEGDLFTSDNNGEYGFNIIYTNNKFKLITADNTLQNIEESDLNKYNFYNRNILGSNYEDYLKRRSLEEFESLSEYDKCDVYKGAYFAKQLNAKADEIINTIEKYCKEDE